MTPNMRVEYVDADTGAVLATDDFHDPGLCWRLGPHGWVAAGAYGVGEALESWLRANPPRLAA